MKNADKSAGQNKSPTVTATSQAKASFFASQETNKQPPNPIRSASMDNVLMSNDKTDDAFASNLENCSHGSSLMLKSPPKTSEWRNEWLAKNEEILRSLSDLDMSKESEDKPEEDEEFEPEPDRVNCRPDWAQPTAVKRKKKREVFVDRLRTKSPEAELRPPSQNTDSASSSMSSPSSPSKDSKEEKADKEMSEKIRTGKNKIKVTKIYFILI